MFQKKDTLVLNGWILNSKSLYNSILNLEGIAAAKRGLDKNSTKLLQKVITTF